MRTAPAPLLRRRPRLAAVQSANAQPSAAILKGGRGNPSATHQRFLTTYQDWQLDAKRYARVMGVARFTANVVASAAGRCTLRVEERDENGDWDETKRPELVDLMHDYSNGTLGQTASELVRLHAWHYQVAGEGALIVRDDQNGQAEWLCCSLDCIEWDRPGPDLVTVKMHPTGTVREHTAFVVPRKQFIRFWMPDEEWLGMAVSPMTAAIDDLRRYRSLVRMASRTADNYLAMNGMLWTPASAHEQAGDPGDDVPSEGAAPKQDEVLRSYQEYARIGIADDDRLESVVPPMVWWEGNPPQWVKIGEGLDAEGREHRQEALEDFARDVEIPASMVTGGGTANANHWSAWLVDEAFFGSGVAPTMDRITHQDITVTYLAPRLRLVGLNAEDFRVGYDETPVVVHPDKSDKALRAWLAGLLAGDTVLEEMGFDLDKRATPQDLEILAGVLQGFAQGVPGAPQIPSPTAEGPVGPATTDELPPELAPVTPLTPLAAATRILAPYLPRQREHITIGAVNVHNGNGHEPALVAAITVPAEEVWAELRPGVPFPDPSDPATYGGKTPEQVALFAEALRATFPGASQPVSV